MNNKQNLGQQRRKSVPVITNTGLVAQLPLSQIARSGQITVCHGTTASGQQVNSPAYHVTGGSTVISPDQNFKIGMSLGNADMELLATTWLRERGFTVNAPAAAQA